VPGGGLNPQRQWQPCKRGFFLPVRVLSRLFKRLFLEQLTARHDELKFYGQLEHLIDPVQFSTYLESTRRKRPTATLRMPYLRHTHGHH